MESKVKKEVGNLVKYCEIDLSVCVTQVSLYSTILGSYDIVIGMDWLESHKEVLYCKNNIFSFVDDE
jgi:hypothetical protein